MIRAINLDSSFLPVPVPEIEFDLVKFSAGEVHIKLNNRINYEKITKVVITHRVQSSDDLMLIFLTTDALRRKGITSIDLVLPYLPYARQDRQCVDGEPFSLEVLAKLINSQDYLKVITFDVHSLVASTLINRLENVSNEDYVNRTLLVLNQVRKITDISLVSPDKGASQKSKALFESTRVFTNLIQCEKTRDPQTGALSGFTVLAEDLKGRDCLIVDDICDGGGTFIGVAKALKNRNAGDLYLFVTHGIFSRGFTELRKYYKDIFTTNTFKDWNMDGVVKQFKIGL